MQASVRLGTMMSALPQSLAISWTNSGVKPAYSAPLSAMAGSIKIKFSGVLNWSKNWETISNCRKEPR